MKIRILGIIFVFMTFPKELIAQSGSENPLFQAMMINDYNRLESLVKQGADINGPPGSKTILHMLNDPMGDLAIFANRQVNASKEEERKKIELLKSLPPSLSERMVPLIRSLFGSEPS